MQDDKFQPIDSTIEYRDGVISGKNFLCKVNDFFKTLEKSYNNLYNYLCNHFENQGTIPKYLPEKEQTKLFTEGMECEILGIDGKGWKKGKFRIKVTLEFCPDEPEITESESPLDELRRQISEATSS
ncbi:MAG: KGK domain-containing protein [Nostocaceae cyanobacterium]|nr:KGK domain-containing protein [Nostocaceae cyanobacterium]